MKFEVGADARKRYVGRRQEDLVRFRSAQGTGDLEAIRALAHQLKGNGTTFGFPELTEHAAVLEVLAKSGDKDRVALEIDWFEAWLKTQVA